MLVLSCYSSFSLLFFNFNSTVNCTEYCHVAIRALGDVFAATDALAQAHRDAAHSETRPSCGQWANLIMYSLKWAERSPSVHVIVCLNVNVFLFVDFVCALFPVISMRITYYHFIQVPCEFRVTVSLGCAEDYLPFYSDILGNVFFLLLSPHALIYFLI